MYEFLSLLLLVAACLLVVRWFKPPNLPEAILVFYCTATGHIVIWGLLLSAINHLAGIEYWAAISALTTACYLLAGRHRFTGKVDVGYFRNLAAALRPTQFSRYELAVLFPLVVTVSITGLLQLLAILFSAPHNWDSMTYHLARVAYYLQHNNLDYFEANYWAQVVHPKNSAILLLYTYLASGREENLTQLVQFLSYWVSLCSIYAISRKVGTTRIQGLFAALVTGLLVNWLMESTTTQNDLVITAFFGSMVYALLAYRTARQCKYILLFAAAFGLAAGTKASALLPLILIVLLVPVVASCQPAPALRTTLKESGLFAASTILAMGIFAIPSGYLDNLNRFGNPIGTQQIRQMHSFDGKPASYVAVNGTLNLFRYSFDSLTLDGMPPVSAVLKFQEIMKSTPKKILDILGINLEKQEASRQPFMFNKRPMAHEDSSYWGVMGFGLVGLALFLALLRQQVTAEIRLLAGAALLFVIIQAYAGPYDPWRGRYFIAAGIFAAPALTVCLEIKPLLPCLPVSNHSFWLHLCHVLRTFAGQWFTAIA